MKNLLGTILLAGMVSAIPSCPTWPNNYPYTDFTWQNYYSTPSRPVDTLLDNCQGIGLRDPQLCSVIQDSRFSTDQKKQLLLDDLITQNNKPAFNEADQWNNRILFTKRAPDGISTTNTRNFKDAWIKFYSVTPSVQDYSQNKLYVNESGKIKVAYGFSFVIQNQSFPSDCRTDYKICGYSYSLTAYDNGRLLPYSNGGFNFDEYDKPPNARNDFYTYLSANSQYLIHHYNLFTTCTGYGWYQYCTTSCDYNYTDDKRDGLSIADAKTAFYFKPNLTVKAFVDGFENNVIDVWLYYSPEKEVPQIQFSTTDSSLAIRQGQYKLTYDLPPYNAVTPSFTNGNELTQTKKLSVLYNEEKNNSKTVHILGVSQQLECNVDVSNHFGINTLQGICSYNETQQPTLNISISNQTSTTFQVKAHFYDDSSATPLANKTIQFSYANQTASLETDANGSTELTFNYSAGSNIVFATFTTDFETRSTKTKTVVPTYFSVKLEDMFYWLTLVFTAYLAVNYLRRRYS